MISISAKNSSDKNKTSTKKAPVKNKKEEKIEHPQRAIEEPVKRADKPIQSKHSGTHNLKNIFDKVEEEKPVEEPEENKPADDFNEEELNQYWEEFLEKLKKTEHEAAYNVLRAAQKELKSDYIISFEFESRSIAKEFMNQRDELIRFLRNKLNNYSINTEIIIKKGGVKKYIQKSDKDIFKEMIKKNPLLLKMKQELGLDFNSGD